MTFRSRCARRALPLAGVAVELALHQGGNLLSADHGVTNDSGIYFLTLDTSAMSSGVGYWLDINIGGVYLTGESIVAGSVDCGTPKSISHDWHDFSRRRARSAHR